MSNLSARELFYRPGDERAVLSYCFKKMDYFYDLSSKLTEFDFLADSHQMLFAIFKELSSEGVSHFDLSLIIGKAQSNAVLDMIGGASYIQSIAGIQASPENFNTYINNVAEASLKFQTHLSLTNHIKNVEQNAQSGKTSAELISNVESNMLDMTSRSLLNEDPILFGSTLDTFIAERKDKKVRMTGISTGFPILDRQIDGLIPGTLMIVGARKKMGKSAFLTNVGLHVAYRTFVPTLYIDTELTYSEWECRALAIITGIKERDIKHGGWDREQLTKIENAKELIKRGKLFHKYMPGFSVDKIVSICKKYKIKENIGLIIFDYLKEPEITSANSGRSEYQLLGDVTTKLKDISGILKVPAITAVQLNRQHDIADSDKIARYGDIITLWSARTEDEKEKGGPECGHYKLVIKDTRRGGSTNAEGIGYRFHKTRLTIQEVPAGYQYFINQGEEVTNADESDDSDYENRYIEDDELA